MGSFLVLLLLTGLLLHGQVVDPSGRPVEGAKVRSIGRQADEFAVTGPDGKFRFAAPGEWLLVVHPRWAPALAGGRSPRVELPPPEAIRQIPACPPGRAGWIGPEEGFRLRDPQRRNDAPIAGEHDVHWFVSYGQQRLFVGTKAFLHPGLPEAELLRGALHLSVKGWRHGADHGLDLRGQASDGTWWRWVGRDFDQQVLYSGASPETRRYFDRIIDTMCVAP